MKDHGLTLLELLIALGLISFCLAAGLRFATGLVRQHQLHGTGQKLVATLNQARRLAVARNAVIQLETDGAGKRFGLKARSNSAPEFWTYLPAEVDWARLPSRRITFFPRGSAAPAGSLAVANSAGTLRVVVAVSGRVRWQMED